MKEKKERTILWSPAGRVSYPFFAAADSGRDLSDDAFKGDLLIPKAIFKEQGKAIQEAILKVGRAEFGPNFKLVGSKYRIPLKDMDTDDRVANEAMRNSIMIRAKSGKRKSGPAVQPVFIGPRKGPDGRFVPLTQEQIADIRPGDWCKFQISVYAYTQQTGGVSFGLQAVQFWKSDRTGFESGRSESIQTAEELEVELDDADTNASAEIEDSII